MLESCKIEDITTGESPNGFKILSSVKSFTVYAKTLEEKESWIKTIADAATIWKVKSSNWNPKPSTGTHTSITSNQFLRC